MDNAEMSVRWLGVLALCVISLQCGGQTPVTQTSVSPTPVVAPETSAPVSVPEVVPPVAAGGRAPVEMKRLGALREQAVGEALEAHVDG